MSDEPSGSVVPADKSNWNAILKWSMAQQGDGTSGAPPAREMSEDVAAREGRKTVSRN